MVGITTGRLTLARRSANQYLRDSCVLMPRAESSSNGEDTVTYPDGDTVACLVSPLGLGGQEEIVAGRLASQEPFLIELATTVSITERDRIRSVATGATFEVTSVEAHSLEVLRKVKVVKVS